MFIEPIIIILVIFFVIAVFSLHTFLILFFKEKELTASELQISIIIAAKNEERNIPGLIESLLLIDYPGNNFEIIIIDDGSNDNTFNLIENLIKGHPNISVYKAENKRYPAKKGTLDFGIAKANFPYIVITDADCNPAPGWLKSFSAKFSQGCEIVYGPVIFYKQKNIINKISSFERLRNSILTFSLAQINFHYTASGGNFGFKKSSYEKLKGYSSTLKTFSGDDDLLLQHAIKSNFIIGTIGKEAFVYTESKNNLRDYLHQKIRHTKTSLYYLPSRILLLTTWHLVNIIFLLSPALLFLSPYFISLFFCKILLDAITILSFQNKFNYRFNIFEIIYLQIIYEMFLVVNFMLSITQKDRWK